MQHETLVTVTTENIPESFSSSVLLALCYTNKIFECVDDRIATRRLNCSGIVWDILAEVLLSGIG